MENIVKTLLEKLSFYSNDNANAGEYLTQHLDEVKDTDTLEDILLTILMQRQRWNDNGSNYNQDYRRRLIQWFTGNERLSPVLQAGVTKLMEYDSELFPASVIKLEKLENRQKTQKSASIPACTEKQKLKLWLIDPEAFQERNAVLTLVMEQKKKFHLYTEYLRLFRERIVDIAKSYSRKYAAEKALADLIQKNIFTSTKSAQYKFLLEHYTEMDIAALNFYFYEYSNDIKKDNIKVRFLQCLCNIKEAEELDEFKLSMIKEVMSSSFSRYVASCKTCQQYFEMKTFEKPGIEDGFHTIFQSDEAYQKFYGAMKPIANFKHHGYLRFDPLLPENHGKWNVIEPKAKINLLEYRAGALLSKDPHARYSEEQKKQVETLHGLAKELFEKLSDPKNNATLPEFLRCNLAHNLLTAFIQAGLETVLEPINEVRLWYDDLEPQYQYLYQLKLWRETGKIDGIQLLGWSNGNTRTCACSLLDQMVKNPYLTDDEKQLYFCMVQETIWKDRIEHYPGFLYDMMITHKELAMRFLNKEERTEVAKELCHDHPSLLKSLADYLMSQEERDNYLKQEEKRQEEEKKRQKLFRFQKEARYALNDLIFHDSNWKIMSLSDTCLHEALTEIALRNMIEKWDGKNISLLIYKLAGITSKTECHSILLRTIQNLCIGQIEDIS